MADNKRDDWADLDAQRHFEKLVTSYKDRPAMLAALASKLQKHGSSRLNPTWNEADHE
jgi:hypothetical protein